MRLILHIGQQKAGSTALQSFLANNRRTLARHGIAYPATPFGSIEHGALSSLVFEKSRWPRQITHRAGTPGQRPRPEGRRLIRELERISRRRDVHTVVVSTEYLFRELSESNKKALADQVLSKFEDVTALAYIREPADRYLSQCLQRIRHSSTIPNPGSGRFRKVLESWAEVVPLSVRGYDRELLSGGDVVLDFIEHFLPQVPREQLDCKPPRDNVALSPEIGAILQQYRRSLYPEQDNVIRSDGKRLAQMLTRIAEKEGCLNRARLYPCIRDHILWKFADELRWLNETHGVRFSQPSTATKGRQAAQPRVRNIEDICFVDDALQTRLEMLVWQHYLGRATVPGLAFLRIAANWIRSQLSR